MHTELCDYVSSWHPLPFIKEVNTYTHYTLWGPLYLIRSPAWTAISLLGRVWVGVAVVTMSSSLGLVGCGEGSSWLGSNELLWCRKSLSWCRCNVSSLDLLTLPSSPNVNNVYHSCMGHCNVPLPDGSWIDASLTRLSWLVISSFTLPNAVNTSLIVWVVSLLVCQTHVNQGASTPVVGWNW